MGFDLVSLQLAVGGLVLSIGIIVGIVILIKKGMAKDKVEDSLLSEDLDEAEDDLDIDDDSEEEDDDDDDVEEEESHAEEEDLQQTKEEEESSDIE
ncbi:MAG: hypothetical protein ACE5GM_08580 [bacterium]